MNEWEQGVVERYDKESTTVMEDKNRKTRHVTCWTSSFKREHAPFLSNKFRTLKT
jgi:hypothetical protein